MELNIRDVGRSGVRYGLCLDCLILSTTQDIVRKYINHLLSNWLMTLKRLAPPRKKSVELLSLLPGPASRIQMALAVAGPGCGWSVSEGIKPLRTQFPVSLLAVSWLTRAQSCLGLTAINMWGLRQAAAILILVTVSAIAFKVDVIDSGFLDEDASAVVIEGWDL